MTMQGGYTCVGCEGLERELGWKITDSPLLEGEYVAVKNGNVISHRVDKYMVQVWQALIADRRKLAEIGEELDAAGREGVSLSVVNVLKRIRAILAGDQQP